MKSRIILRKIVPAFILFCVVIISTQEIFAGNKKSTGDLWKKTTETNIEFQGRRGLFPEKYLTFKLNSDALRRFLREMPLEFTEESLNRSVVVEIPMPDGSFSRFRIEESNILAAHLKKDFLDWKTFNGYGVDDTTATARFDWTSKGFHGYIFTSKGTVYIDPFQENDTANYLVYYKHEYGKSDGFSCRIQPEIELFEPEDLRLNYISFAPAFSNGTNIRTYRIAIATTGEWARGTTMSTDPQTVRTAALAALTTSVNRLDGIYRRELSVSLQLVNPPITNDATNIIFDDPMTDPYNNTDSEAQLTINHNTITARVGTPNFDVGHLYGTGGGGVASSPSVCRNDSKGEGYSARAGFYGDPFTVDYAAHEVGHQFGGSHTYNNSDMGGACTTRSAMNAYEVASGSTIMSYVGICNQRNLQQYVDTGIPMFHIRSLTQMITNIQDTNDGGSCGTAGPNNNSIPTVNAGNSFTIPRLTPFTLTATGNDADGGDVANLLYSWEQYDLSPSASGELGTPAGTFDVDTDGVLRPLFRAYSPVTSPSRTFPSLAFILNPANNNPAGSNNPPLTYTGTHPTNAPGAVCEPMVTCAVGESLPSVNRTMNFRVSLRDQRGGIVDAGTTVTVAAAAGPFRVTTQDTAATWAGNSQQTVNWDVAGTDGNGINVANVKISLSTDGGQSFPITILASTPNDGAEQITVPNNATTQARIKVEAVGNIFFDINNVNFTITASAPMNTVRSDFDGDGRSDLSVFRPTDGNWYLLRSTAGLAVADFGLNNDTIVPADFDGDRKTDLAVWRPTNTDGQPDFYVLQSTNSTVTGVAWGVVNDIPVVADYDGDEKDDFAIWRPSTGDFYVLQSQSGNLRHYNFGLAGDKPVPGNFDGDNKADFAVFRPSNATWYVAKSTDNTVITSQWGLATDIPVFADYDGDNRDDIAVFRPSDGVWYIQRSMGGISYIPFGTDGDVPVPGDYDGDGKYDQAVYRNGTWYLNNSTSGNSVANFGVAGDNPIPRHYLPQ
jgi:hypothetical protein